MADGGVGLDDLKRENEALRHENVRLQRAVAEAHGRLREPEDVLRAIRAGEIDALVVQQEGQEEIYAVQRYDAVYRGLVEESLPYGVWLADEDGKLLHVSRQFLELAQTGLQEMRENGQFHFLPDEIRETFAEQWAECRATGNSCNFRYTIQRSDGSERSIWTHGILTYSYDGTPCWAGINLDVTEQQETKDELRQKAEALEEVDRRKDEFLALLGHELRNPMAVIQHGLHLLRDTSGEDPASRQVMEPMFNQVNHLSRLVDDLLDVSRINRGAIGLRKERVELATAVHNCVDSVRSLIDARGHHLTVSLPSSPVYLEADPTRLEQILSNLLNNAAKYTRIGGTIQLDARLEDRTVVIRVNDNGNGISPELLPHIFELFVQSDQALDRSQGGLGIGLTVVRSLVELHGGTISVQSEGLGKGSQFEVRLPVLLAQQGEATGPQEAPPQEGGKVRILLAEDSEDLARIMKRMIQSWGHEVRVTDDGPSTLDAYRTLLPEVVLLDIGLPGMDGYEVARAIRNDASGSGPVIVAMTGYGQEGDRARSQAAGFDHHLVKPANMNELRSIFEAARESKAV